MKYGISLFLILIFAQNIFGQKKIVNLAPNPSFEELRNLPLKRTKRPITAYEPTSGYIPFRSNLNFWFKGTQTTPDLRITRMDLLKDCERKWDDCDKAHSGIRSVGLMTWLRNSYMDDYREYMQVKLKKPLKSGVKTYAEIWVSKERNAKIVSNNIGFYFSKTKIFKDTEGPVGIQPQINCDSLINPVKKEWVKVGGSFIPDKDYAFVTVGNFFGNEATDTMKFEAFTGRQFIPPYAYYLVDDIKIWQEGDTTEVVFFGKKEIKVNEAFELQNIHFQTDKAVLQPESFKELNKLANFLKMHPDLKLDIHGHTDDIGEKLYNLTLSQNRAKAVFNYFVEKGISESRLKYQGFGEEKPVEKGTSEEIRSQNRRVEFYFMKN